MLRQTILLACVSAFWAHISAAKAADDQVCSVATLPTWHDLIVNRRTELEGPLHEVFGTIMSNTKFDWQIAKPVPWRRAVAAFVAGHHAAAMPVLETKERRAKFLYVGPISHFVSHFIENIDAPKNNVLSASRALQGVDDYQKIIARFDDVVWSENFTDAWRVFELGRTQYTLMPGSGVPFLEEARNQPTYVFDAIPSRSRPMYIMLHKDHPCTVDVPIIEAAINSNRLQID